MMYCIFIFILWIAYMSFEGWREGMYWHYLFKANGSPSYEHKLWTVQRLIPAILIILCVSLIYNNIEKIILLTPCLVLSSPFFYDGFYYQSRHELDKNIYKKGFWDQSTTSTAFLTKLCTPVLRSIYFLTSVIIFLIFVL